MCAAARDVVLAVCANEPDVQLIERSIDDDAELREAYHDEIPVVRLNGVQHSYWSVDPARLRAALAAIRAR